MEPDHISLDKNTVAIQTHALYTEAGQRIAARLIKDDQAHKARIVFVDTDRMIDGEYLVSYYKSWDDHSIVASVMHHYLYNDYDHSAVDGDYVKYREITQELYKLAKQAPKRRGR